MRFVLSTCIVLCAAIWLKASDARPLSGKGEGAKTLLIYSDTRAQFSLSEGLEVLRLQLRRVATEVESVAVSNATPEMIKNADYVVVFCPQSRPGLTTNFLHSLTNRAGQTLWVGFGANELEELRPYAGEFVFSKLHSEKHGSNVVYRGRTWEGAVYPWMPVRLTTNTTSRVLMTVQDQGQARPLAWRSSNMTFVATVPLWGTLSYLFGDLLLDFYEASNVPESRVFLRLEDYTAQSDHGEFRRAADFLHARKIPFMLAITPSWRDPEFGMVENVDANEEFRTGLRYAQQRGARLVMKGAVRDGNKLEFWDARLDQPVAGESALHYRARIQENVWLLLKHGLFPLAWETPGSAASRAAYTAVADVFSTAIERLQLADTTARESYVTSAATIDRYGRFVVPENGGYVLLAATNALEGIREKLDVITSLRGTIGGCYIHCYQPLSKLMELVNLLEGYKLRFLDLAEVDNTVQAPGALLMTGKAKKTLDLQNAMVQRRTFDRFGTPLAHEREAQPYTGHRTFQGTEGEYVLIEFESKP